MVWLLFITAVLSLTYLGAKKGRFCWIYRIVLLLVLSLMTGLGSPAGQDHHAYVEMFYMFTQFSDLTDIRVILESYAIEPGYILLNVIGNMLHMSEPLFFIFLSIFMHLSV